MITRLLFGCVSLSGSSKRFRMRGPPLGGDTVEQWNSDVSGVLLVVAMFVLTIGCQHSKCRPFFPCFFLPQVRIGDSQKVIVFQVWSAYRVKFRLKEGQYYL